MPEIEKEEGKPKGSSKMLIIIVGVIILAGAGGYFFMSKSSGSGGKEENTHEGKSGGHGEAKGGHEKTGEKTGTSGIIHPLDTFIVNLADPNRTRYLKITIQLEMDKSESVTEVSSKTTQIRDALIILLSSKSIDEIAAAEGKYQLRDEIVVRVNQFMTKGRAVTAYFTDLVVQ